MSSRVILCQVKKAENPYYIEDINRCLYSIEELCWFVDHNLALAADGFFDSTLTDWIRSELGLHDLADRMDRIMQESGEETFGQDVSGQEKSGEESLSESAAEQSGAEQRDVRGDHTLEQLIDALNAEISWIYVKDRAAFRREIAELLHLLPGERMKRRADTLVGYGKYTRAVRVYKKILRDADEEVLPPETPEETTGSEETETAESTGNDSGETAGDELSTDSTENVSAEAVPAEETTEEPAEETAEDTAEEPAGDAVSADETADVSAEAVPAEESTDHASGDALKEAAESTENISGEPAEEPAEESAADAVSADGTEEVSAEAVPAEESTDHASGDALKEAAESTENSSEETAEDTAEDTAEEPAVDTAEETAEEPAGDAVSADETADVSAEAVPAEESTDHASGDAQTEAAGSAACAVKTETAEVSAPVRRESEKEERIRKLKGTVWHNMGVAYSRLFQFDEACGCLKKGYELLHNGASLQDYLYCVNISRGSEAYNRLAEQYGVDPETKEEMDRSMASFRPPARPENDDEALNTWVRGYHRETAP